VGRVSRSNPVPRAPKGGVEARGRNLGSRRRPEFTLPGFVGNG
jgi:hypothetical protein